MTIRHEVLKMRKFISIAISAIMAVSMCTAAALPAFAADNVSSPTASTIPDTTVPGTTVPGTSTTESTTLATLRDGMVTPTVNGQNIQGVTYGFSATNPNEVTFRYDGEGTLISWEDNLVALGLVSGTDFVAVQNTDGSYTITFMTQTGVNQWNSGNVKVNAIVDFGEDTTVIEEVEEEETEEETTKKNVSSKSPSTGVSTAVIAGGIAVAGAGFAVLTASKKKDAE